MYQGNSYGTGGSNMSNINHLISMGNASGLQSNSLMSLAGNSSNILGYKPQANSLMQPQPSPVMEGAMISHGGRINQKNLIQLQQIQKEQLAREQEQKEVLAIQHQAEEQAQHAALALTQSRLSNQKAVTVDPIEQQNLMINQNFANSDPNTSVKEQAILSSGFAQSLYGNPSGMNKEGGENNPNNQLMLKGPGGLGDKIGLNGGTSDGLSMTGFQQAQLNGMQSYMNNIKQTTQAIHQHHVQMLTQQHISQIPTLVPGQNMPDPNQMTQHINPQLLNNLGPMSNDNPNNLSGRIGTTASNNSAAVINISTYYSKGMTYP